MRAGARFLFFFTLIAGLIHGSSASAETMTPCSETVREWVGRAADELPFAIEPVSCLPTHARVRLLPQEGPSLDVEIARAPRVAFVRLDGLGVSPIVNVEDYNQLPLPQRRAFEQLLRWLRANETEISFGSSSTPTLPGIEQGGAPLPLGWPALLLALLLLFVARQGMEKQQFGGKTIALFFIVSLALRALFGLWGPLHINGQGPLWISGAAESPRALAAYGVGYPEIYGVVANLGGSAPDLAIFAFNAFLSAAIPTIVLVLALDLGFERGRALTAAAFAALDPVLIRTAATEGYFTPLIFLSTLAALALVTVTSSAWRGPHWRAVSALVAAAIFATLTARIHPVGWLPLMASLALPLLAPFAQASRRGPLIRIVIGCLIIGLVLVTTSLSSLVDVAAHATAHYGPSSSDAPALLNGENVGGAVIIVGVVLVLCAFNRHRPLLLGALPALLLVYVTRDIYAQSALWQACYDRLFAVPFLLALAAFMTKSRTPSAGFVRSTIYATMAAVVVFVTARDELTTQTTEQQEYALLREGVSEIPAECSLLTLPRVERRIVEIPTYLTQARVYQLTDPAEIEGLNRSCVYWLQTSICSTAQGRETCQAIQRGAEFEEVWREELANLPSYDGLPYEPGPVVIALFRRE